MESKLYLLSLTTVQYSQRSLGFLIQWKPSGNKNCFTRETHTVFPGWKLFLLLTACTWNQYSWLGTWIDSASTIPIHMATKSYNRISQIYFNHVHHSLHQIWYNNSSSILEHLQITSTAGINVISTSFHSSNAHVLVTSKFPIPNQDTPPQNKIADLFKITHWNCQTFLLVALLACNRLFFYMIPLVYKCLRIPFFYIISLANDDATKLQLNIPEICVSTHHQLTKLGLLPN